MNQTVKRKLTLYSISLVLIPIIFTIIGTGALTIYQTKRKNEKRISNAIGQLQRVLLEKVKYLDRQINQFVNDEENPMIVFDTINRVRLKGIQQTYGYGAKILDKLFFLGQATNTENIAFYFPSQVNGTDELQYIYSKKNNGILLVQNKKDAVLFIRDNVLGFKKKK